MPWATYSIISKSSLSDKTFQNMPSTLPSQVWQPNYNNSPNSWPALLLLQLLLCLRHQHLLLLSAPLPWSQTLYLNSKQGQNSPLPQTSLVNKVLVGPSSTPAPSICTWPQSSSAAMRRKSSGPSPSSKKGRAARWSKNLFCQEADTGIFPIRSWTEFEQQFWSQFFLVNAEADAINTLEGSLYY